MRYSFFSLIFAAVAAVQIGCGRVKSQQKPPASREAATDDEPPLLLDDEPLLLLDDNPDTSSPAGPMADNSRCFVCHINYMQEDIALTHARADIGCADCHGDSDAHIADESWSWGENGTAPDTMYRRAEVNEFCMTCHPGDKIKTEQHKPFFAGTAKEKYCTDCHGDHRLAKRRCKWR